MPPRTGWRWPAIAGTFGLLHFSLFTVRSISTSLISRTISYLLFPRKTKGSSRVKYNYEFGNEIVCIDMVLIYKGGQIVRTIVDKNMVVLVPQLNDSVPHAIEHNGTYVLSA